MAKKKPKTRTMNSYSNKKDYIKRLEEAGDVSGRTQEEADQDAAIDAIFAGEDEKEDDRNWIDKLFDRMSK